MTFNPNISLDTSGVDRGGGHRGAVIGGGVGGLGLIGAILYFVFTGQTPPLEMLQTSDLNYDANNSVSVEELASECRTGTDANENSLCRMVAGKNSLDVFWNEDLPAETGGKLAYSPAGLTLYDGVTDTACGTGTSQTGPFYCPADQSVYIDVTFYDQLQSMGAENTSLAQLYILAHEWGHHIQNQLGILSQMDHNDLGPNGDMVRSELQADCLAGAWINNAANTVDPDTGVTYLQKPTSEQLKSALAAASAVGDDKIYENAGMSANPDNFSHGSAEKRMQWLKTGMEGGTIASCDTWNVATP